MSPNVFRRVNGLVWLLRCEKRRFQFHRTLRKVVAAERPGTSTTWKLPSGHMQNSIPNVKSLLVASFSRPPIRNSSRLYSATPHDSHLGSCGRSILRLTPPPNLN